MPDRGRRRGPRELREALGGVRRKAAPPTLLAAVQERWRDVVGPAVADEALPVAERGGVVTVVCRSAVWASELALLSDTFLERLNEGLGGPKVLALRFKTGTL